MQAVRTHKRQHPKRCPACGEKRPGITLAPRQVFKDTLGVETYLYILVGVLILALLGVIGLIGYALL